MEIKSRNPKIKHYEIARELKKSSSTLQRYRKEVNMLPPDRIPIIHTRKQKSCNRDPKKTTHDLKKTSNDLNVTPKDNDNAVSKKVKSKHISKGGNLDDVNHSNGRDYIEQTFSSQ